jgi:hypothetical protein
VSGQFNNIAFNIGAAAEIVEIVVVPVVLSLLILDLVRRLRKHEQARGFEVQPVPPAAHKP